MRETIHTQTASLQVPFGTESVFAVVADVFLLPTWWFGRSDGPEYRPSNSEVEVTRGEEARFTPGTELKVTSTAGTAMWRGRERRIEDPSIWHFRCHEAIPGELVALHHRRDGSPEKSEHLRTEIRLARVGTESRVTVTQQLAIRGASPLAWLGRKMNDKAEAPQRVMIGNIERLVAEHRGG